MRIYQSPSLTRLGSLGAVKLVGLVTMYLENSELELASKKLNGLEFTDSSICFEIFINNELESKNTTSFFKIG